MILKLIRKGQQGVRMNNMPYTQSNSYSPGVGLAQSIDYNYGEPYSMGQGPRRPIEFNKLQPISDRAIVAPSGDIGLAKMQTKEVPVQGGGPGGMDVAGAVGGATMMASGAIEAFSKAPGTDQYGIKGSEDKSKAMWQGGLETAGKYAGAGATIGTLFGGPVGTAIGAGVGALVGGVVGAVGAKKDNEQEQIAYKQQFQSAYSADKSSKYAQQYAAMGQGGMKMKIQSRLNTATNTKLVPSYRNGGTMYNVIAGGKLHKENNNLGNKDKGIPVIDSTGKKIFELEKEELILNDITTNKVEELVKKYNTEPEDSILESLGEFMYKELKLKTVDKSKTYTNEGKN